MVFELGTSTLEGTISNSLAQKFELKEKDIVNILCDIVSGVHFLYSEMGMNHRDLKPWNMIWVNGNLKVADIGAAELRTLKYNPKTGKNTLNPE